MASPYENLPLTAFWRSGVVESSPSNMEGIYKKKWDLTPDLKVATAGSCFAQHISRYMRKNGFSVMDVEVAPPELPTESHEKYGYGLYTARYGNVYTVHQLLQLAKEVFTEEKPGDIAWEKEGRYYDALRPAVQPEGFDSREALFDSRKKHLDSIRQMFVEMDVFVFTLGLTEAWVNRTNNTVYPTAPETIAGEFDPRIYEFKNFNAFEIVEAFETLTCLLERVRENKPRLKFILTVSPVPLTATAAGGHILQATTYSKSVLRAVAGYLSDRYDNISYFPSYEIITNPASKSSFYESNLRSVRPEGVASVMQVFFREYGTNGHDTDRNQKHQSDDDVQCEEILLETFGNPTKKQENDDKKLVVFVGDSHLSGVKSCVEKYFSDYQDRYKFAFVPASWMSSPLVDVEAHQYLTSIQLKDEYKSFAASVPTAEQMKAGANICFVGLGILGDGVIRAHGAMTPGEVTEAGISKGSNPVPPTIGEKNEIESVRQGRLSVKQINGFEQGIKPYIHNLNVRVNIYKKIADKNIYRSLRWIASPNMVERTARFRFGDEYVDNKSHVLHTRLAESYVQDFILDEHNDGWLLTHPEKYEGDSGFTKDEFAYAEALNDIHTNADFYRDVIERYFKSIS